MGVSVHTSLTGVHCSVLSPNFRNFLRLFTLFGLELGLSIFFIQSLQMGYLQELLS